MTDAERLEAARALREIDQQTAEMVRLLNVHDLPIAAAGYAHAIQARLALVDRLVRKP